MTRAEYERLKRDYYLKGRRALGKPEGSKAHKDYEEAKHKYHRAGEELRRERRSG